jgi:hypothetical protein
LIQGLTDLGYSEAAQALSKESGYQLEGPTVAAFRNAVLRGDWAKAEELLVGTNDYDYGGGITLDVSWASRHNSGSKTPRPASTSRQMGGLNLAADANRDEMLFRMKEQKYLELLEKRDIASALAVLRQELAPLYRDVRRLRSLSGYVLYLHMVLRGQSTNHDQSYDVSIC